MTNADSSAATAKSPVPPLSLGVIFLTLYIDLIGFSLFFPLGPELLIHYQQTEAAGGLFHSLIAWLQGIAHASGDVQFATGALFAGVIGSLYSFTQFLFSPVWGARSDRVGRRPVLLYSVAGNALSFLVLACSGSFLVFLVSRVLSGIMGGNLAVAIAAVSDVTTRENRAKGMGIVGAAFGIGFLTGPAIGGLTAHWNILAVAPGLSAWGFHPFSATALIGFVLCLVNLVWIAARFRETLPTDRRGLGTTTLRERNPLHALFLLPDAVLRRANLVGFLSTFGFCFFETTITFFTARELHYGPRELTMIFVVNGLVSIFTQGFLVRRAVPALGERQVALTGIFLVGASLGGLGYAIGVAHSVPLMYAALAACAVGSGFANVGLSSLVSLYASPADQGKVTGIYRSLGFLARAACPIVAGLLFFHTGGTVTFTVAAVILAVPLFLGLKLPQPHK